MTLFTKIPTYVQHALKRELSNRISNNANMIYILISDYKYS